MAGQKFTLTFDAQMNVNQMKGALSQIQSTLNGLHLPQNITKGLQGTFDNLSKEIQNFEASLGKDITSKVDFNKLNRQAEKVTTTFEKLKLQVKELAGLSSKDLERLLPSDIVSNINKATKAMEQYGRQVDTAKNKVTEAQNGVEKLNQKIANISNKTPITDTKWKELNAAIKSANEEVDRYKTALESAKENQDRIAKGLKEPSKSSTWRNARDEVTEFTAKLKEAEERVKALGTQKANSITFTKQAEELAKLNVQLTEAQTKLKAAEDALAKLESTSQGGGLQDLANEVSQLTGLDLSNFTGTIEDLKEIVAQFAAGEVDKLKAGVDQVKGSVDNATPAVRDFGNAMRQGSEEAEQLEARMRDVSALKSRIQYFFGLTNTINLFRQAIRGAYETIKELDKAMTETAVVTDFSVGDMWKQLPEYTKRANELGVTTKAAYEAATLYYQQGLTTQEVNELSVETLKMARIAGLDAAEATDRMTNALRGFNMELTAVNAQRIDDVYSRLAAITASDVDEISTAMTKVASLAHNAGMEFETTAAFLAQIIETTRESAETAGTALKTVVARFAEVKKLVNEGELKGEDQEGELVDVNKVSAALRTAGIDLNRYFLGEVGIDDIFMELAEKWDSLNSLQQRYIATQAAGSRQQSRFIALMADYARTQELVEEAYNANGAAAQQFEKTQDSLESKLARLKNAWDEFLMGLTNNVVVKAGVDLLTDLLNTVNKLTSAFGEGAGSVMKWVLAIGALRSAGSLFKTGGLIEKALSGSIFGNALGLTGGVKSGSALLGGAKGIGSLLLGGTFGMGAELTGMAGVTAAATGLAAALGAVAVAAGAAYGAYRLWLKYTPEGQLKAAQKHAEALQQEAKQAQQTADSIQNLQDNYQRYTDAINNATNVTERQTAIQQRNDAILKAIEENPDYAQYLDTDFDVNGELILTLNEESVTQAAIEAAKEATDAAITSYFSQAEVALKEAAVTAQSQQPKYTGNENGFLGARVQISKGDTSAATEILRQNQLATAQNWAKTAYASMIKSAEDLDLTNEVANGLATMLSKIFMETDGQEIGRITVEAIARGISQGQIDEDIVKAITAENFDFSMADFNPDSLEEFSELLGFNIDNLSDLDRQLNIEEGTIRKLIAARAAEVKEVQKSNRAKLFEEIMRNGVSLDKAMQDFINALSPEKVEDALNLLMSGNSVLTEGLQKSLAIDLPNLTDEDYVGLERLFNSFNLDDPIKALSTLNSALENGSKYVRKYAGALKQLNKDTFSKGNLFQSFLSSEAYDDVAESIEKLRKENGKLSPKDIIELAEESDDLKSILDDTDLSVNALTKAFNALNDGAPLGGLTDAVLDAFDATADLDDLIYELHETIANFDAGIDYGEGTDFVVDLTDQLLEMTENYEFGNQQFKNIYDQLFGKGAYDEFMASWGQRGIDEFAAEAKARIEALKNWADEESYGFMLASAQGLTGIEGISGGPEEFVWDVGTKTTEELRKYVSDTLGVSLDTAMALIEGAMAHMPDLTLELKTNDYNAALNEIVSGTDSTITVTQAELETLATQYNKTLEQIKSDLQQAATTAGKDISIPTIIDWTDSNGSPLTDEALTKKFNENVNIDTALQGAIDEASGNINADKLLSNLTDMGLTPEQAAQIAQKIADDLNAQFEKTVVHPKIEIDDENNIVVSEESITVTSGSLAALNIEAQTQLENAFNETQYSLVAEHLAAQDYDGVRTTLQNAIYTAAENGQGVLDSTINNTQFGGVYTSLYSSVYDGVVVAYNNAAAQIASTPLQVQVQEVSIPNIHALGAGAAGGKVPSLASGADRFLQPGWALTGEEAPEIVWNKEQGYAYITGVNGPEFRNLQPGDQIFNAQETSRILRNTSFAKGGYYDSYAKGKWNLGKINERRNRNSSGSSGSGSGSGSDSSNSTPTVWENDLDWLYNLMEDIAELERIQTRLSEQHDRYLKDISKTGRDLYNTTQSQLNNLYTARSNQAEALARRRQEMSEQIGISGYGNYVWWNDRDQTIEIDWDAIEAIQDKDTYDEVKDLISRVEKIQDEMDEAQDALWDIEGQIKELEQRYLQEFTQYQKRVYDAVVKTYQDSIDNLSNLNDTLNDTNSRILDSISKEIDLERQIRDNTDTENTIADMEARLAYLRRDTTSANEAEIRDLEKQLEDTRENYSDTLIDQQLDRLSEANQQAAEQREQQIALMTAQLEYWQETGALWTEVAQLMEDGIDNNGTIIRGSELEQVLRNADGWKAMSEQQREVWGNELITSTNQAGAYLLKISEGLDGISAGVWAMIPSSSVTSQKLQYATGGLNKATGWAWLDGTANEPEYVLNARQTDAFLRLAEILPSMFNGNSITNNNLGGNVYVELTMNVSNISSDYDVDRFMDRVKSNIYDAASYRNVNAVNFQR